MLDFCVDICLYFLKNPYGVAAIHCKAGKGRTGVMCINYLIFTDLCKSSDEAIEYYAKMRTYNKKVKNYLKKKLIKTIFYFS
jgi:phosphatidylinositol-3,4,5-trisphosphate 3-phosphatase and dual-specificity protein phosphatase PTEN